MKLVDADKLMEDIEIRMKAKENDFKAVSELMAINRYIVQLSPAYDIEAVVEQLKKQDGVCSDCRHKDECNECAIGERFDIVRKGGLYTQN